MNIRTHISAFCCIALLIVTSPVHAGFYGRILQNVALGDTPSGGIETQRHAVVESAIGGKGSTKLGNIRIGGQIELGIADDNDGIERTRVQEIFISGDFGKVSIGAGMDSTGFIDAIDSSDTWIADPLGPLFSTGAGGGAGAGGEFTTKSFNSRIRYDSPKFAGIASISASLEDANLSFDSSSNSSDGNDLSIAARLNTGSFKFNAWTIISDSNNNEHTGVLFGYKHTSGLNLSANMAESGANIETTAIKFGYTTGLNAYSIQTIRTDRPSDLTMITIAPNSAVNDVDGISLSYVRKVAKGIKIWARLAASDGTIISDNTSTEDPRVFALGGLVKF